MANSLYTNPIVIDTFGADVTIAAGQIVVTEITMMGATAADTVTFIDNDTVPCLKLSNDIGGATKHWKPAKPFRFSNGVVFDDSASDLAANDFILIYKE